MWFHVLEFAVSCTAAKYMFYCSHTTYVPGTRLFKNSALLLHAPTVETRATELRFFSQCPRRHPVRAGLGTAAATVFLDRTAEEESPLHTDFC